jgi:DNA-binding MarR family transcriptional regulator
MRPNLESTELAWKLWRQLYQTSTLLKRCEDQTFEEHGLTTEQYAVLLSIEYLGGPARITDIAQWLERSTNSVSMLVDRMVKAGLVKRSRERGDRRVVRVAATSRGEAALKPANVASLQLIQKIMSPLSPEDGRALFELLGTVKHEALKYLNPGIDIEEVKRTESKQTANTKKWLSKYSSSPAAKAKPEAEGKGKARKKAK